MNLSSELLFILFCFPLRIIISILPNSELLVRFFNKIKIKINTNIFYTIFGIILLLISFGFLYLFFSNKRLRAGEAGGKTWWHNLRLFHGMMYLCASIYVLKNIGNNNLIKCASIPLVCDVIVGFIAFVNYRFLKK